MEFLAAFLRQYVKKCKKVGKSGWKWHEFAYVCLGEPLSNRGNAKTTTTRL